jgi:DNA-directed RNA polymerase II subunit RPB1
VVEVVSRNTYEDNKPVIGGLFDPRMGVLESGFICPTDGLTYIETPGYFGHIELARPVFYIQHFKEIMKIHKCVCYKCSKLLMNKSKHTHILNYPAEDKWKYVYEHCSKIKRCGNDNADGCGYKQPDKYKQEQMANIVAVWENIEVNDNNEKNTVTMKLTPELVLKIFKRISDEDVAFMGFHPKWSRPDWMVCTVLPVPPPAVRPSVKHDAQQRSEDDLTHIYSNIIRTNSELLKKINDNAAVNVLDSLTLVLQYYIAMVVNNKVKGSFPMAQRSGRPLQCITGRLNSKTGRIRGNLMGKRVNYSARSVITGDPNLSIAQLGIPLKIAKNLTKPVMVNLQNIQFLTKLVQNGPDIYPGAKTLEKKGVADPTSLRNVDLSTVQLEIGDIVHRHLMDGDAVLFNRQPSLHRMSMMAHIAKIMFVGDTFRMNVGDTPPYNADFDGDEMNMHVPQNILSETELRHLAAIPYQIISPRSNSPIIGIFQDSLLGSFRFTREKLLFSPREAMNLLMMFRDVNVAELMKSMKANGGKISNFDILSQVMPPLTIEYKTDMFKKDKDDASTSNHVLEIKNGKYIRGQIYKGVINGGTKGLIHRINNDFSNKEAVAFIDNFQNIITEFMKTSAYSVGISDLIANKETYTQIQMEIEKKKTEVQDIMNEVHLGIFKNVTANNSMIEFESRILNLLNNKAREKTSEIAKESLSKNNRFVMIITSGSKGSVINITQMIACLGQQDVDGKRIPYGFDSRTLPHFSKFDDSANARGFVENSYISGLTSQELFFHAMAGRIGLIDTAVKTSTTGYIQRRLIKGLEDLKVEYDMTVRNSMGKIVQFRYGGDGFDSVKVEGQKIPLGSYSIADIYAHYQIVGVNTEKTDEMSLFSAAAQSRCKKQKEQATIRCKELIDLLIVSRDDLVEKVFKNKDEEGVNTPIGFAYLISNIQGQLEIQPDNIVDITPWEALQMMDEYFDKIQRIHYSPPTQLFKILYYFYLSPKEILIKRRFHKKALTLLLETIFLKYKQAIVHPGEMVGVIAGQSLGEPTTQLTLNTFHLSGVSSKSNVTRGVPRIEEIIRLTKNPKNPSMTIHLRELEKDNQEKAKYFATIIEHTRLIDIVESMQICFDPLNDQTNIPTDQVLLKQFYEFEKLMLSDLENVNVQPKSKWIIRMVMNREIMLDKNITMDDVHFAIKNSHEGSEIQCVFSDYNMENLVFRIRINSSVFKKTKKQGFIKSLDQSDEIYLLKNFQDNLLNNIVLRGITGVNNVIPRKLSTTFVQKKEGKFVIVNDKENAIIKKDVWILDTTGTNLLDTLALDFIDSTRTFSNDIKEVFDVLGIEAARQMIYNEFFDVMEFSSVYINYHHLSLLADRMTSTKEMTAIYRSGILNDDIGPIAKATFEVHTEVLLDAARHGQFDRMRGISANVMCGQYGYYGTNAFNVLLDLNKLTEEKDLIILDKTEEIEKALGNVDEDKCSLENIRIQNDIKNIKQGHMVELCNDDTFDVGF